MKISFLFLLLLVSTLAFGKFETRSSLSYMKKLSPVADCLIKNEGFRAEVSAIQKFDFSTKTGLQVIKDFDEMPTVTLSTYWYYSKTVIATTYKKSVKKELYFNTRANPRSVPAMINTVMHETRHLLGDGHGDNYSAGKQFSIPYYVGKIAEKYVPECVL